MILQTERVRLRLPETMDVEALHRQKNDPEIANLLGGFSTGYSRTAIAEWIDFHRKREDEVIWVIADASTDECLGHVGLYQIDHRVRSAEFAVLLGVKDRWGTGLGTDVTRLVLRFGFEMLNLNRISLSVLANNTRARRLYQRLGFEEEGILRQSQFKEGRYLDVVLMALLREQYDANGTIYNTTSLKVASAVRAKP